MAARDGSALGLVLGLVIGLAVVSTPAEAVQQTASGVRCTVVGTSGNDVLRGTRGRDVICGRGGHDRIDGAVLTFDSRGAQGASGNGPRCWP